MTSGVTQFSFRLTYTMNLTDGFVLLVLTYVVSGIQAGKLGSTCTSSNACTTGQCCRDVNNHVLVLGEGPGGMFGGPMLEGRNGTCMAGNAQKGEMCDSVCQCAPGLTCFRPMSGVCCPPYTCVDASYAKQQNEYWSNCFSNPKCALPP